MGVGGARGDTSGNLVGMMDVDGRAVDDKRDVAFSLGDTAVPRSSPSSSHSQIHGHGEGDNRDVEDMELSEGEEADGTNIIG